MCAGLCFSLPHSLPSCLLLSMSHLLTEHSLPLLSLHPPPPTGGFESQLSLFYMYFLLLLLLFLPPFSSSSPPPSPSSSGYLLLVASELHVTLSSSSSSSSSPPPPPPPAPLVMYIQSINGLRRSFLCRVKIERVQTRPHSQQGQWALDRKAPSRVSGHYIVNRKTVLSVLCSYMRTYTVVYVTVCTQCKWACIHTCTCTADMHVLVCMYAVHCTCMLWGMLFSACTFVGSCLATKILKAHISKVKW